MTLSKAEISAIVKGAAEGGEPSVRPPWAVGMRRMLNALTDFEFRPGRATALVKLCDAGALYGWRDLEAATNGNLLTCVSPKARASLIRDLRQRLERLTRPCLKLEQTSFALAMNSIGMLAGSTNPQVIERMFLGKKPSDRLFSPFKKFPVLARLWFYSISQWREHVTEVLVRFKRDRTALAHAFFGVQAIGTIADFRCGLSDWHNHGRTVTQLQFEAGAVIYKPRSGEGECEWFSLMQWMTIHAYRPNLKAGRILRRKGYCWMEHIAAASCKDAAAARRFYERIGGMIAAAYLLRAVDCHRDNIIAVGEYPVLVDADALWHVSSVTSTQSALSRMYRTGFFPNSDRRSLQSRSSALGRATTGKHLARIGTKPLIAGRYQQEILRGFSKAWRHLLGTRKRHNAFAARLRRIRSRERRWIYRATETYAAIAKASIQPDVLRSSVERDLLIARMCARDSVSPAVIEAEIAALKRLDIPYFMRTTQERMPPAQGAAPSDVLDALRHALLFS